MSVKLLTEHHLEFLSLKGDCRGSIESTLCQNVKLLEISCHGSFKMPKKKNRINVTRVLHKLNSFLLVLKLHSL